MTRSSHARIPDRSASLAGAIVLGCAALVGCRTVAPAAPPDPRSVSLAIVEGIEDCRFRGRPGCVRLHVRNRGATPLMLATYNVEAGPLLYPYDVWVEIRDRDGTWKNAEVATASEYGAYDSLVVLKPGRSAQLVYFQDHEIPPLATYRLVLRALDSDVKYTSAPATAGH